MESLCFERNKDSSDFSSFALTEWSSSLTSGLGAVVGNKADFSFGRVALIGGGFFIPCLFAKSDFTRHNGNLSARK